MRTRMSTQRLMPDEQAQRKAASMPSRRSDMAVGPPLRAG
jgi:hypothetical protein